MNAVDKAIPAKHFALPPYRAETFSENSAGVMNRNGLNVLTFPSSGRTLTSPAIAELIADKWNAK